MLKCPLINISLSSVVDLMICLRRRAPRVNFFITSYSTLFIIKFMRMCATYKGIPFFIMDDSGSFLVSLYT